MTTACECGADIWCQVCVACEGHCWSARGDEACQEIRKLRTRMKKLDEIETYWGDDLIEAHALFEESNAVCACGCPNEDHENYGEDGMSCPVEGHECVPTSKAVLSMLQRLRKDVQDELASSDMHISLNRRAAKALGKPFEGENSSWHDIPEQIEALQETIERYEAAIKKSIKSMCTEQNWFETVLDTLRAGLEKS